MTGDVARRDRVLVDARGLAAALAGDRPPVVLD
ncbi:sulfurtransferase, partial [Cellulosimicrobium cellulans]|nr:sulfurtransferase [Cellulosimicrobium cellulans]